MEPSSQRAGSATDAGGGVAVAVALGSNLGDRRAHLAFGLERLAAVLQDLHSSSFYDTEPIGVGQQPRFLNAAAVGRTTLPPRALLSRLLEMERERGRDRPYWGAARTLDLDLVLYGEATLDEPGLQVPHPRFREREFVLRPLAEIAPEFRDPVTGLSVRALLDRLQAGGATHIP